ncbi:pseudouridine synthase [Oscillibacter valericigenes Sjm18-20]|nr:pseudouridine synthase [Oscillibacter valericigenes Sjm18-20]
MPYVSHCVSPAESGLTVRHILKQKLHFSSHAISRLTRAEGGILVNGRPAHTTLVLSPGDTVCAESGDVRVQRQAPVPGPWPLPVVWEDEHLLIVNKPAGMTAHVSNFLPDTPTVAGALAYSRGTEFIFHAVNRLDKGTTGLMAIAKSGHVHDLLRKVLHSNQFHREYRAVCVGVPHPAEGVIDLPIGRDETSAVRRMVRPDGQPSVSRYQVLMTRGGFSLLRLFPETGRTHQLRVHMAAVGCPLAGDWLYGTEDPALIARPALHSFRMALVHPITGEPLEFHAELPEDMARLLWD